LTKKSIDEVANDINSDNSDEAGYQLLSTIYINNKSKLEVYHKACGKSYFVNYKDWRDGNRCPYCRGTHKKTTQEFNEELERKHLPYICGKYNGALVKTGFVCNRCGRAFNTRPIDVLQGHGCNCYKKEK